MRKFNLKVLILLSLGHMTVDLYQGALPAILPFLKENLGLTYTMAGVIMIVASFTSSLLQPVFGMVADKEEQAFLLPFGVMTAGLGYSLLSLPSSYAGVLLLVIVGGLGVSAYHPEGFKTAAFFTGEKRGHRHVRLLRRRKPRLCPRSYPGDVDHLPFRILETSGHFVIVAFLVTAAILIARKAIASAGRQGPRGA